MKYFATYLIACLVFMTIQSFAQEKLNIEVRNATTLQAVENAFIFAPDGSMQAFSDYRGIAKISLTPDLDTIHFSHPSFYPEKFTLDEIRSMGNTLFVLERSIFLEEYVVTASKRVEPRDLISNTTQLIYTNQIRLNQTTQNLKILERSGQHSVTYESPGQANLNIRGFTGNQLLTLINGSRSSIPLQQSAGFQQVSPFMIDRIETVFGSGSVIHGSDAIGGVVNLITRQPRISMSSKPEISGKANVHTSTAQFEKTAHAELNFSYQNFGLLTALTFSHFDDYRLGSNQNPFHADFGKVNTYVYRHNQSDFIVNNPEPHLYPNSDFHRIQFFQKLRYQLSAERLLSGHFFYAGTSAAQSMGRKHEKVYAQSEVTGNLEVFEDTTFISLSDTLDYTHFFAEYQNQPLNQIHAGVTYTDYNPFLPGNHLDLSLTYRKAEFGEYFRRFNQPVRYHFNEQLHAVQANLDVQFPIDEQKHLSYGLEYVSRWIDADAYQVDTENGEISTFFNRFPDDKNHKNAFSAYAKFDLDINKKVRITQGFRYSFIHFNSQNASNLSDFHPQEIQYNRSAFSGTIGLSYRPSQQWHFNFTAASGYRTPEVDDIALFYSPAAGILNIPNPDLKPEYSYNLEGRLSFQSSDFLSAEVFGFNTILKNAIIRQPVSFNNVDSTSYTGFPSALVSYVNVGTAYVRGGGYRINAVFNRFVSFETVGNFAEGYDQNFDNKLPHIPPFFGMSRLTFRYQTFKSAVTWNYQAWKDVEDFSPFFEDNLLFATEKGYPSYHLLNIDFMWQWKKHISYHFGVHNLLDAHYRPYGSKISGTGRNFLIGIEARF